MITGGVQYYNQKLLNLKEFIDPVIQRLYKVRPRLFGNRVPKGTLVYGEGLVQKSHRWHGSIGDQAGIDSWGKVEISRVAQGNDQGYDACNYKPRVITYGAETVEFTGFGTSRQTLPICVRDIRFTWQFRQQGTLIVESLAGTSQDIDDNFAQEYYIKLAVDSGNAFILTTDPLDTSNQFDYDGFEVDADGDTYITFPRGLPMSTLNWTFLDYWADFLQIAAPEGSLSGDADMPVYGLVFHKRDFYRMIMEDKDRREDFRFYDDTVLIEGYGRVREFQQYALIHHARAPRFKISSMTAATVTAKRVKPFLTNRVITIGTAIDANPDYQTAEIAMGIIFINQVYQNLIPPAGPSEVGGSMMFGAHPSYNGEYAWLNIQNAETNPLNEVGFFFARFERFPKPLLYSDKPIVFLYRRCPQYWLTGCEIQTDVTEAAHGVKVPIASATAYEIQSGDYLASIKLTQLLPAELGDEVTVTLDDASTKSAIIAATISAPTYLLSFAAGDRPANAAMDDVTVAGVTVA